jgi:hypothetical protein
MPDARFPIRSTSPRQRGERSSLRIWLARVAICTTRSWERSGSHDSQHGEEEAQVGSDRSLEQDLPVGHPLDLRVEGVDGLLAFGQRLDHLAVTAQEGVRRPRQILGDHGEQFDDLGLDSLQLALKFLSLLAHNQSLLSGP